MSGTLYLCATPIGNLEDITFRVINTLKEVDLIAAEDTRHSIKLLNHFEIKTKMTSYHEYNRVEKAKVLVKQLQEGKTIALITDAGTRGISDPGEELVRQCHEAGITVTALPGACALINALIISGQPTRISLSVDLKTLSCFFVSSRHSVIALSPSTSYSSSNVLTRRCGAS